MPLQQTVILIPVLNRPQNVAPLIESILAATDSVETPFSIGFVCTEGDHDEIQEIMNCGFEPLILPGERLPGDYSRKINFGADQTEEHLIFTGADDLRFRRGWLRAAIKRMNGPVGMVGTNDLGNPRVIKGHHSTHSLFSRKYMLVHGTADEKGKIYHEGYTHCFCDDEAVATARSRMRWAFAHDSIVEHMHPHWNKGKEDSTYALAFEHLEDDRKLFMSRRSLWARRHR